MGGSRRLACLLPALGVALAAPAPASASLRSVDVLSRAHLRIVNPAVSTYEGSSLASAGDVNGDGRPDVIIGAAGADENGRRESGSAYVVFGRATPGTVDLNRLGDDGFRIDGPTPQVRVELDATSPSGTYAGAVVAGVGDVNGDGLADVAVGVPRASPRGRVFAGSIYVVLGRRSSAPMDLDSPGSGYRIDGARSFDGLGYSFAGAGDVNGDRRGDLVVSTPREAIVLPGDASPTSVDLADVGPSGYRLVPPPGSAGAVEDGSLLQEQLKAVMGFRVAGAGDVNGDGLGDVLVGATGDDEARPGDDAARPADDGAVFVAFGRRDRADVDLARLGTEGLRLDGEDETHAGSAVAGAGDVNGDGLADVLVGAPDTNAEAVDVPDEGTPDNGAAYVVFGRRSGGRISLGRLRGRGVRIAGEEAGDRAGTAVAPLGDVNGDRRDDVLVGAPGADGGCRSNSGAAYVVFGGRRTGTLRLSSLGPRGYRIDGHARFDALGSGLTGLADADGDRRRDALLAVPAPRANRAVAGSYEVARLPAPGKVRAGLPTPRCVVATILPDRLAKVRRSGVLRVRISARDIRRGQRSVGMVLFIAEDGLSDAQAFIAERRVRFSRPGTRTVAVRVPKGPMRVLRSRSRAFVAAIVVQSTAGDNDRWRYPGVELR